MKMQLYTTTHLRNKLRALGLPHSKPTLYLYEGKGILLPADYPVQHGIYPRRFYSEKRMNENIKRVAKFVKDRERKKAEKAGTPLD